MAQAIRKSVNGVADKWLFWYVYPAMALLVVHVGNDNSIRQLLAIPSYYSDVLLAIACTYALGFFYRRLFRRMDGMFPKQEQLRLRLKYQALFAWLLPVAVLTGIEAIYLVFVLEMPLSESSIFYLEMPVIALFCLILNLVYLFLYRQKSEKVLLARLTDAEKELTEQHRETSERFVVHSGARTLSVYSKDIAYFLVQGKSTFLRTLAGEEYHIDQSLEKVKKEMDGGSFFQLNRQVIARKEAVGCYERTATRKLKITLKPEAGLEVFVSKVKASEFLNWLGIK